MPTEQPLAAADETHRNFSGKRRLSDRPAEEAAFEASQAALLRFSLERLVAYGVHHADAVELRGRVWSGEDWQTVASELAESCLAPPELTISQETAQTRANRLFRASALLRMSQMMLGNGPEKSDIFARAGRLYSEAATLRSDRERQIFETPGGPLVGWLYRSGITPVLGQAVVVGGLDAWAMDHADMGLALASRGIETLVLDGPGQGESRLVKGHFLGHGWEQAYHAVFDELERRHPNLPMGFVGNSMGGAIALHLAARDRRIVACCDNCGPNLRRLHEGAPLSEPMTAQCGDIPVQTALDVWKSIEPVHPDFPVRCPLLVVHGALDRLVSTDVARSMFEAGVAHDRRLFIYGDGDHCVYNHADDKHALISDWIVSRLVARDGGGSQCS